MAKINELLLTLPDVIKKRAPNFKIKYKDESVLMKVLNIILFFDKTFMHRTTTFLSTVYFSTREHVQRSKTSCGITLAHEYVHIIDGNKQPITFALGYCSPQIWAVFSLFSFLAFWHWAFLFFLLFLVCLAPFPSPWRAKWEERGHFMSIILERKRDGGFLTGTRDSLVKSFSGWSYYCMQSKQDAQVTAQRIMDSAREVKTPEDNPAYKDVLDLLNRPSILEDGGDMLDLLCRMSEPPGACNN